MIKNNQMLSEQYGNHYIDMIAFIQESDGLVRAFTDDLHLISRDCGHLTQYGARYYARIIDLSWITEMNNRR